MGNASGFLFLFCFFSWKLFTWPKSFNKKNDLRTFPSCVSCSPVPCGPQCAAFIGSQS